jgi:hypothetical protein
MSPEPALSWWIAELDLAGMLVLPAASTNLNDPTRR